MKKFSIKTRGLSCEAHSRAKQGFTLIELLVVISIIGLLSSIVLAALNGARQKGVVGAGLQFAAYNYHYLGINALAMYNFEEPLGGNALDSSGNKFDLTLVGCSSSPFCRSQSITPTGTGNSLALTGSPQYAYYTNPNGLTTGSVTQATVSVWVNPSSLVSASWYCVFIISSDTNITLLNGTRNMAICLIGPSTLRIDDVSGSGGINSFPGAIQLNQWQNITISENGNQGIVYVNGKAISPLSIGSLSFTPKEIGVGMVNNGSYFKGYIDDVAVYNQALSEGQIQHLYAMEAPKHGITLK